MSEPYKTTIRSLAGNFELSVPNDPSRTIEVIGAGASRTGTMSLALALEILLNGPVMHGGTQVALREDSYVRKVHRFLTNRNDKPVMMKLLREITAGFVGITDSPGSSFVPELQELYPEAKVILVTRDPQRWVESMGPILRAWDLWWMSLIVWPCPTWRWFPSLLKEVLVKEAERLPSLVEGQPLTGKILEEHNESIKACTPKNKLLVMDMKQGWRPLCAFLNKPIPDVPFPHVNDSKAMEGVMKRVVLVCSAVWVGIFSVAGLSFWGACRLYRA